MVLSSFIGLFMDETLDEALFHVDYERNKTDGYPESHLQVIADSTRWKLACPDRALGQLHLPTGSRRYRPALEDIIEFLISERLTLGREGWQDKVQQGREAFHRRQMRAAIRRDPAPAVKILEENGYTVVPPTVVNLRGKTKKHQRL
jgi:hypothetical protein